MSTVNSLLKPYVKYREEKNNRFLEKFGVDKL